MLFKSSCQNAQLAVFNSHVVGVNPLALFDFMPYVIALRFKDYKVFRRIVFDISVDMVNYLAFHERPSEFLCGNNSVDRRCADFEIPGGLARRFLPPAYIGAVLSATLSLVARAQSKRGIAVNTLLFYATAAGKCMARLRAPSSRARGPACLTGIHSLIIPLTPDINNCWFSPACIRPQATLWGAE